jgi:flagellar biosynthesis/type III secretory pathway ATPase
MDLSAHREQESLNPRNHLRTANPLEQLTHQYPWFELLYEIFVYRAGSSCSCLSAAIHWLQQMVLWIEGS